MPSSAALAMMVPALIIIVPLQSIPSEVPETCKLPPSITIASFTLMPSLTVLVAIIVPLVK